MTSKQDTHPTADAANPRVRRRRTAVLAGTLFTLSGALGLGYQLVWVRKATLVVGSSQIALATVLTSFFLGLALGSLAVGKYGRSRRLSSLFVYGLFEFGIGIYALSFPLLFGWLEASYAGLYGFASGSATALFFLRFALLFLLFLAPTFLMGGTLPLLLDGLVERDASVGSLTSLLYGLNIVGAVIGVLLTGYVAIPQLGINGTNLAAGVGNLSLGILALLAFRRTPPLHLPSSSSEHEPGPETFYYVLAIVSGLASIGYQIAWARYFSLFKTASVYLTALLLAVFLTALAAGSMLMSRLLAMRVRPLRVIAVLQPVAALLVLYGLSWWRLADYELNATNFDISPSWHFASEVADTIFFAPLFQIALVILLPVTLLGTALPGIIAAATPYSAQLRANSGRLVFWNTIGASAGGFASGYVLIPTVGLTGTFFVLSLLTLGMGAAAEFKLQRVESAGRRRVDWVYGLVAVALAGAVLFSRTNVTRHTLTTYGPIARIDSVNAIDIVEGPLTTGSVFSNPGNLYIASDDQILAVVRQNDLSVQAVEGHLPALFYPRAGTPKQILGIAVGSGQSFGALLNYPIERMDVVDISTEMIQLSLKHFSEYNHGLGQDPRVTFHLDDGRHFVERAPAESYDVVSLEPPPPTAPGVHTLYSLEFYQAVKRVLRDDGVLMQWVPLYWLTPNETRGLIKTQAQVFPQTFVVRMGPIDFVTLSYKRDAPPRFHLSWIEERAEVFAREHAVSTTPWTKLCHHGTASLEGVLALLTTGPEDVARMEAPYIYRDDDQRLSYSSGDRQLLRRYYKSILPLISFRELSLTPFDQLQEYFAEPIPAAELDEERVRALRLYGLPSPAAVAEARAEFERATTPPDRARLALRIAQLNSYDFPLSLSWLNKAIQADIHASSAWVGEWATYHVTLHSRELQRWFNALSRPQRISPIGGAVEGALRSFAAAEQKRRDAYLLPSF